MPHLLSDETVGGCCLIQRKSLHETSLRIILSNQVVISDEDIAFDFLKKPEVHLKIVMQ